MTDKLKTTFEGGQLKAEHMSKMKETTRCWPSSRTMCGMGGCGCEASTLSAKNWLCAARLNSLPTLNAAYD